MSTKTEEKQVFKAEVEPELASGPCAAATAAANVDADLELAHAGDKVWLVKLPRFLFERWENCAEGMDLGTLMINEANRRDMKVVLNPELQGGDSKDGQTELPVEYALEMINSNLHNTYVFSEPPLPPLQSAPDDSNPEDNSSSRLNTPTETRSSAFREDQARRKAGGPDRSRKGLGGQAIRGRVVHDCLVKPVDNLHYRNLLRGRTTAADVPRRRVISMNDNGTNFIQPGQLGGSKSFNTFIQSKTGQAVKSRDVNARLPLKDLYDAIFKCFEEYEFWSLKAFKKKLKQPEAYLKDTLDNIATLHKRGSHVGTWELKQETKKAQQASIAAIAANNSSPEVKHEGQEAPEDLGALTDADEDVDVEMEDRM